MFIQSPSKDNYLESKAFGQTRQILADFTSKMWPCPHIHNEPKEQKGILIDIQKNMIMAQSSDIKIH